MVLLYVGENEPLIAASTAEKSTAEKVKSFCLSIRPQWLFYFLSVCTGQFVRCSTWKWSVAALFFLTFPLLVNILSSVFNAVIIFGCIFAYCGYIDTKVSVHNNSLYGLVPESLPQFADFQKFVFTAASLSGTISYMWITLAVLYPNYSKFRDCIAWIKGKITSMWEACDGDTKNPRDGDTKNPELELLNPFCDNDDSQSTLLRSKQSFYFHLIFWFNLLTFASSILTFFLLFSMIYNRHDVFWKRFIDIGGLVSQFYSWFCATLSCFIFSKVAYAVVNLCTYNLFACFEVIATMEEKDLQDFAQGEKPDIILLQHDILDKMKNLKDKQNKYSDLLKSSCTKTSYVEGLKVIDKWYTHTVKTSLHPYGTWFALHWLLYTLTAFLSIACVIEVVVKELYGHDPDDEQCHGEHNIKCRLTLAYTILFSFNHCILFLYPCFRAASVTAARYSLIKKVSSAYWPNVPIDQKQMFIQYLKDQDCTFKVSILCAKLSFGFNIAYFSIFVGIMGVVLKISL